VLLTGEGGIGKSRLLQVMTAHIEGESHAQFECRSSPYYQHTALYPMVDLWERICTFTRDDSPGEKLGKLEQALQAYRCADQETVSLLAALLSMPLPEDRYPPLSLSPQRQRQKTLETLLAILLEQSEHHPLLFIMEDLHWTDPSTLELLDLLLDRTPTAALFVILTCRPTFQPSWDSRKHVMSLELNRLTAGQIKAMVDRLTGGKCLPDEMVHQIVVKTDGVPLFIEEMTKAIVESGVLQTIDDQCRLTGPMPSLTIPSTLQDSLMSRLDRLVTAKGIAQLGATIGRQFSYELLQALTALDEAALQRELGRLVDAELLYQRGAPPLAIYLFKHALIQDAAYQSLLKSSRQQYHQRIAQLLSTRFPETAETQPELLAHHYTQAGLHQQAIPFWQRAGERAIERSANIEAVDHLTRGLALLETLPDTPERTEQELALQLALGPPLAWTKGFGAPEVETMYSRACELCRQVGETSQLFPALWGMWHFYVLRAELSKAQEPAEQLISFAQRAHNSALLPDAYRALGETLLWSGEFAPAQVQLKLGIAAYDPKLNHSDVFHPGEDSGVACRFLSGIALWYLGYPDRALQKVYEAVSLAQALSHPLSLSAAHSFASWLHQYRREGRESQEQAEAAMAIAVEQDFGFFIAFDKMLLGRALAMQGRLDEGIAEMRQGLAAYQATGAEALQLHWLITLAEVYGKAGRVEEGLAVLTDAQDLADRHGSERWLDEELYRLKGELRWQNAKNQGQEVKLEAEVEACFQQAIEIARQQSAKSWELRAAMSLSRLWQMQGKKAKARSLLQEIYDWFKEGFGTADLKEAKALLEELS
jgi:predicted ATPase